VSHLKQISIPDSDTWAIKYVNNLTQQKRLSPTIIRALKFYDKYQHLLEDDGTLPALVDMIKELQLQVKQLNDKLDNVQFVSQEVEGSQKINSDDWLLELEEMQ
jgi:hypothetical protein